VCTAVLLAEFPLLAALLQQRNAGANWVLRVWLDFCTKQLEQLRKEDESLQQQLRALSDVPEKDKAGKGSSKDSLKDKEEQLTKKANQVRRLTRFMFSLSRMYGCCVCCYSGRVWEVWALRWAMLTVFGSRM
jgi:hypothetical protein